MRPWATNPERSRPSEVGTFLASPPARSYGICAAAASLLLNSAEGHPRPSATAGSCVPRPLVSTGASPFLRRRGRPSAGSYPSVLCDRHVRRTRRGPVGGEARSPLHPNRNGPSPGSPARRAWVVCAASTRAPARMDMRRLGKAPSYRGRYVTSSCAPRDAATAGRGPAERTPRSRPAPVSPRPRARVRAHHLTCGRARACGSGRSPPFPHPRDRHPLRDRRPAEPIEGGGGQRVMLSPHVLRPLPMCLSGETAGPHYRILGPSRGLRGARQLPAATVISYPRRVGFEDAVASAGFSDRVSDAFEAGTRSRGEDVLVWALHAWHVRYPDRECYRASVIANRGIEPTGQAARSRREETIDHHSQDVVASARLGKKGRGRV